MVFLLRHPDGGRAALTSSHRASEPCWYLNLLGVRPEHQGEGIGSALLQVALARGDEAGEPANLEATSPDNRRLYERHGFRVVRELSLPDGPSLWAMWRAPAA